MRPGHILSEIRLKDLGPGGSGSPEIFGSRPGADAKSISRHFQPKPAQAGPGSPGATKFLLIWAVHSLSPAKAVLCL